MGQACGCHSCFAATSSLLFTTRASCRADASEHAFYTTCKHCGPIVLHPYHQLYAIQTVEVCAFEMTTSTTARLSCTRRTTRSTNDAHQCTCPVLCSQWSLLSQSSLRPVSLPFAHHRSACWSSCRVEGLRSLRCSVCCRVRGASLPARVVLAIDRDPIKKVCEGWSQDLYGSIYTIAIECIVHACMYSVYMNTEVHCENTVGRACGCHLRVAASPRWCLLVIGVTCTLQIGLHRSHNYLRTVHGERLSVNMKTGHVAW